MIPLSPEAEAQLDALLDHYEQLDRPEATRNLILALDQAADRIEREPAEGLPSPRPYPALADLGFQWIKVGAYWFAYVSSAQGFVVAGVFYATADIPNRIRR